MVFAGGEKEVGVSRVELDLVDGVPVADVVLDAGLRGGVEDAHDAARPRYCEERQEGFLLVRPCTCVKCFVHLE